MDDQDAVKSDAGGSVDSVERALRDGNGSVSDTSSANDGDGGLQTDSEDEDDTRFCCEYLTTLTEERSAGAWAPFDVLVSLLFYIGTS